MYALMMMGNACTVCVCLVSPKVALTFLETIQDELVGSQLFFLSSVVATILVSSIRRTMVVKVGIVGAWALGLDYYKDKTRSTSLSFSISTRNCGTYIWHQQTSHPQQPVHHL